MVELVRAGRSPDDLAKEFEPTAPVDSQLGGSGGARCEPSSDGLTSEERQETWLWRDNRVLREEREILSKAAAWFATETGSVPSRRSNS
jgi:transposase